MRSVAFSCLVVVALAPAALATATDSPAPSGALPVEAQVVDPNSEGLATEAGVKSPMLLEIEALLLSERDQIAALQARLLASSNQDAANRLQREISELKQATEKNLLLVQLRYAQAAGQLELAKQLEAGIDMLEHPVLPLHKSERPQPRR